MDIPCVKLIPKLLGSIHDDGDNDVPAGFVEPNLFFGQDSMSRVKDDMDGQMWAAFQQNP